MNLGREERERERSESGDALPLPPRLQSEVGRRLTKQGRQDLFPAHSLGLSERAGVENASACLFYLPVVDVPRGEASQVNLREVPVTPRMHPQLTAIT